MDGFHLSDAALDRLGLRDRKGAIETFDAAGYLALLRRLRAEADRLEAEFTRDIVNRLVEAGGIDELRGAAATPAPEEPA